MFSSKAKYTKLKTNLRLCANRLSLLQKKKTEMALKSRREVAELLKANKIDRARIRVEQIIREDYCVEAMDIIETYCLLLLERFGVIEEQKSVDPSLEKAISTLIWSKRLLNTEVQELNVIHDQLVAKYGKVYCQSCQTNSLNTVNEAVMGKLNVTAPGENLVEMYLVEIAKSFDVSYEPDLTLIHKNTCPNPQNDLINFNSLSEPPMPCLPQNFNDTSGIWSHGEVSEKAPYPSDVYPNTADHPPPLPSQPPAVDPNLKAPNGMDAQPPPYDMNVFPDQVSIENRIRNNEDFEKKPLPDTDIRNPETNDATPPYPSSSAPTRPVAEPPESQDNETGVDLDDLTRRFNQLKK